MLQTLLVTGGYNDNQDISSTEILRDNSPAWLFTGELPSPRSYLRGVSINNRVMVTGGSLKGEYYDDILEFDPSQGAWTHLGKMMVARRTHAVSTVNWEDVREFCQDLQLYFQD